jgi:hypothetical protein
MLYQITADNALTGLVMREAIFLLVTKASFHNSFLDHDGEISRTRIPISWHTLFKTKYKFCYKASEFGIISNSQYLGEDSSVNHSLMQSV